MERGSAQDRRGSWSNEVLEMERGTAQDGAKMMLNEGAEGARQME
jgi:hypothetical protein